MTLSDSPAAQVRAACSAAADAAPARATLPLQQGAAITAQQHGGPWPSSTHAFSTRVDPAALERLLRPMALRSAPAWLLAAKGQA